MTEKVNDYTKVIESCAKHIDKIIGSSAWKEDNRVIELFGVYYQAIYNQVHNVLVPMRTAEAERQVREIIAKYVIGYTHSKARKAWIGSLKPLRAKIQQVIKLGNVRMEYKAQYAELYDNFMALAAFRSFKYYCLYMQDCFNFTLWEDTQNCFEGYMHYAGKMVLDGDVRFIEKQCPTGYGKSISDAFMQSWIFGIDVDHDILKVCGNDKFTEDCFQNVVDKLMLTPQYAKVFPYYAQFNCERNSMFSYCSAQNLKFAITGSNKSTNLRIVTKLSDVNGVRAKFLFLDDITQRRDMANLAMHNKDIHAFENEWFERNYGRDKFFIVASGTTYSQFDLLSHVKRKFGGDNAVQSKINKYTSIAYSDSIVQHGLSVFVCVPLLDPDTDESTYPKKISTFNARKKREENPVEFWAMDMQQPLPPDNSPFYFTRLRQYSVRPQIGENGRDESCLASLDTKRRGKDFLSMPILFEANDPERPTDKVFYLHDWLYDDRPMKDCIPLIVDKIISNHIVRLYVERNTEECIQTILLDKLKERGYTACVIDEVYSTEIKDMRIMMAEGDIKSKIIFPEYGMYAQSHDIGKALMNVYGYNYGMSSRTAHDDAPDSLALFAKRFIMNNYLQYGSISSFKR